MATRGCSAASAAFLASPQPTANPYRPELTAAAKVEVKTMLIQEALERAAAEPLKTIDELKDRVSAPVATLLEHLSVQTLFDPRLNVTTWMRACNVRDNSIGLKFHHEVGEPPKKFLERLRMESAKRLLVDTDLQLWRISEVLGYASLAAFSKAFLRYAGQRPSVYRTEGQEGRPERKASASLHIIARPTANGWKLCWADTKISLPETGPLNLLLLDEVPDQAP